MSEPGETPSDGILETSGLHHLNCTPTTALRGFRLVPLHRGFDVLV